MLRTLGAAALLLSLAVQCADPMQDPLCDGFIATVSNVSTTVTDPSVSVDWQGAVRDANTSLRVDLRLTSGMGNPISRLNQRPALFDNVPPGEYVAEVRLSRDGCDDRSAVSQSFTIAEPDPCDTFESTTITGDIAQVNADEVTIDWVGFPSGADSFTVALSGAGPESIAMSKPANFSGLVDGAWSYTITYSLATCSNVSTQGDFTIDTSVDCTAWNAGSVEAPDSQVMDQSVTIDWTLTNLPPEDTFRVVILSGPSVPAPVVGQKPATFMNLTAGGYTAEIQYLKGGCTNQTVQAPFTIAPSATGVSWSMDVHPALQMSCGGCHGSGHGSGLNLGGNAQTVLQELNDPPQVTQGGCAGLDYTARISPGDSAASIILARIGGTCDSPQMFGLSGAEIQDLADWIDQGAPNN